MSGDKIAAFALVLSIVIYMLARTGLSFCTIMNVSYCLCMTNRKVDAGMHPNCRTYVILHSSVTLHHYEYVVSASHIQ